MSTNSELLPSYTYSIITVWRQKLAKHSTCLQFVFQVVEFFFFCPSFPFVLLEQGVQDLQGGSDVLRHNILWINAGHLKACVVEEV